MAFFCMEFVIEPYRLNECPERMTFFYIFNIVLKILQQFYCSLYEKCFWRVSVIFSSRQMLWCSGHLKTISTFVTVCVFQPGLVTHYNNLEHPKPPPYQGAGIRTVDISVPIDKSLLSSTLVPKQANSLCYGMTLRPWHEQGHVCTKLVPKHPTHVDYRSQ